MSIYKYDDKNPHKSGFSGFRVVVSVDGKYLQKYFPLSAGKEAKNLEKEWLFLQSLEQHKRMAEMTPNLRSVFATPVKTIRQRFVRIKTTKPSGKKYDTFTPEYIVNGSYKNKRYHKVFNIKERGADNAWMLAVNAAASYKGLQPNSLFERRPPLEQFYLIYKYQVEHLKHKVPLRRFPEELLKTQGGIIGIKDFLEVECGMDFKLYPELIA